MTKREPETEKRWSGWVERYGLLSGANNARYELP